MPKHVVIRGTHVSLEQGDLSRVVVDALVNAANGQLTPGGGVDGALHAAGGAALLEARQRAREERGGAAIATGEAVLTAAGELPAKWVVHAVGPVWRGGDSGEPELLASAYRWAMTLASNAGARSIALPSLSTGAFGYPVELAAPVALGAVRQWLLDHPSGLFRKVQFVLYDAPTLAAFEAAVEAILHGGPALPQHRR